MILGLAMAVLSGFIALSYEILWYRAYSFASGSAATTFGWMLSAYLAGLAFGALGVRGFCRPVSEENSRTNLGTLFLLILGVNALGYFVVPGAALLAAKGVSPDLSYIQVGLASSGLGAIFPLVNHLCIAPDERAGRHISWIYLANILGSSAGSFLTGFVLLDRWTLAGMHVFLALLGIGMAAVTLISPQAPQRTGRLALTLALALAAGSFGHAPFAGVYEKLQLKTSYRPGTRFAEVIETKSGVITVNDQGQVFGGGLYDGAFNTSPEGEDRNKIIRCYMLAGLHAAPKDVLMIGLGSGSWGWAVARLPEVERLTIVEINRGYLDLLPRHPEVADLVKNPKVRIEIDDGRRWLARRRTASST